MGEFLYFAPGLSFEAVDFSGERLPEQIEYLVVLLCAREGHVSRVSASFLHRPQPLSDKTHRVADLRSNRRKHIAVAAGQRMKPVQLLWLCLWSSLTS
jgi:hypothetical protein